MTKNKQTQTKNPTKIKTDLRLERRGRGLTRKQVARIIGMSIDSVDSYETGKRLPSLVNALKLQILYRSQLAGLYEQLYQQLTAQVREAETNSRIPINRNRI